ncbi:MAG TPA: hypothetical protein ENN22_09785, partial [bacterium]|nr:hypothetical protein [bacterium]
TLYSDAPSWNMYGQNPARTNFSRDNIDVPLTLKWRHSASAAIGKTLLVSNGVLFFSTMDGNIHAFSIDSGKKIGSKKTGFHSTFVLSDSLLFIARRYGDDTLFRYNLKTGKTDWKLNAGDISSEPLLFENEIVITALYKHIDMYKLSTGEKIWKFDTPDHIHSSAASDGDFIIFGCDDGNIYALNKSDGKLAWKFKTGAAVQSTAAINGGIAFVGSLDGNFYAIDIKSGELRWQFLTDGQLFHGAAVTTEMVIFGSTDGWLYNVDQQTGSLNWEFKTGSVISTSPLVCNDKVFFGTLDRHYYAVDINSGEQIWKYKTRGRVRTAAIVWNHYLIGASEDSHVYVFSAEEH